MSIAINSNFERDQYEATGGQTQFTYSFPIFDETYLSVYQRAGTATPNDATDLLTLGTDYTVSGVGAEAGGYITLTVAATAGDIVTVVGEEPIDRESVFDDLNPFTVALNQQLNEQTVMAQQTYTYWNHVTPRYYFSTLVSDQVRPLKRILPMLPDGHVWIGRGEIGDDPDDISTLYVADAGLGNVLAAGPGMRESITRWTGTDFIISDSEVNMSDAQFSPTAGTTEEVAGFTDAWGAFHWPAHSTADRPSVASDGDVYYDTDTAEFYGYVLGTWTAFGGGGGGSSGVTKTITQVTHGFIVGDIVRLDSSGDYVKAQADSSVDAESIGMVKTVVDADVFILQMIGYISGLPGGLVDGDVYFLSDTLPGQMTNVEPTTNGYVSKPVFIADTATSGWILQMRGYVINLAEDGPVTPPGVVVIDVTQVAHGFIVGDVVKISASDTYAKAQANTVANARAAGMVIEVIDVDNFKLQQSGFTTALSGLTPAAQYWLSPSTAGAITTVEPSSVGQATKPMLLALNATSGWILPQRPLVVAASGDGSTIAPQWGYGNPNRPYILPWMANFPKGVTPLGAVAVANQIYLYPLLISTQQTFTKIGMYLKSSSGTGSSYKARLGIYNADSSTIPGFPGTLLDDYGLIDWGGSMGENNITISETLQGRYWICLIQNSTTSSARINFNDGAGAGAHETAGMLTNAFGSTIGEVNTNCMAYLTEASVSSYFTALPADLSSDTFVEQEASTTPPGIYLKVS